MLIELSLMFHKHHFYTLLCVFTVYSAFFLNYFDRAYVKFILGNFLFSFVLDFVWLIVLAKVIIIFILGLLGSKSINLSFNFTYRIFKICSIYGMCLDVVKNYYSYFIYQIQSSRRSRKKESNFIWTNLYV